VPHHVHGRVPREPAGAVAEVDDAAPVASEASSLTSEASSLTSEASPLTADAVDRPLDSRPSAGRAPRPTLWEQGRHPGRLVLRATTLLLLTVAGLNVLVTGALGLPFDLVFIAACALVALWVRPRDFFMIGVYPPIVLGALVITLAVAEPATVARADDPAGQAIVSGLAHQAWPLVTGYALTLAIIALRQVAIRNRGRLRLR
jgi:hypothetical protein